MKCTLSLLLILSGTQLLSATFNVFGPPEYPKIRRAAPGIAGADYLNFAPLGPTDLGFSFGLNFNLSGNEETRPVYFWIKKGSESITVIDSLAAVNSVIRDMGETNEYTDTKATIPNGASLGVSYPHVEIVGGDQDAMRKNRRQPQFAISTIRELLSIHMTRFGRTGFSLALDTSMGGSDGSLARAIARLQSNGLDQETADLLLHLGKDCSEKVNLDTQEWIAVWYEVDRLGGIEKVTIKGTIGPPKIRSVLREAIFDAGKVKPDILMRDKIIDLTKAL